MRMEVLLVRLAGGSASFCRVGQGGFDAKCERGGRVTSYVLPPKATMERPCLFSWWGPVCKFSFPKAAWKHKWEDQFHNLRAPLLKFSSPWKEVPLALDQLS